ncbi:hypothetical protein ABPG72_015020 [Tetrahymena utriculariae]
MLSKQIICLNELTNLSRRLLSKASVQLFDILAKNIKKFSKHKRKIPAKIPLFFFLTSLKDLVKQNSKNKSLKDKQFFTFLSISNFFLLLFLFSYILYLIFFTINQQQKLFKQSDLFIYQLNTNIKRQTNKQLNKQMQI